MVLLLLYTLPMLITQPVSLRLLGWGGAACGWKAHENLEVILEKICEPRQVSYGQVS